jgi:dTMP kinase
MAEGLLISVEGHDKCGKSTQIDYLAKNFVLDGREVVIIHFPDYDSPTGEIIRDILDGVHPLDVRENALEVQSLYIINRYEMQIRIEHALMAGKVVICDRYLHSTVAYGLATGLDYDWISSTQHSLVQPDITILLDIDGQEYKKRCGNYNDLDEFEKDYETIKKIRDIYLSFAKENKWITQFAVGDKEELARLIYNQVTHKIEELYGRA